MNREKRPCAGFSTLPMGATLKRTVLTGLLALMSANAFSGVSDIVAANNQVRANLYFTTVDYTEYGDGAYGTRTGILDTEKGPVPGGSVSASYMGSSNKAYASAELGYAGGHTHYTGAPLTGNSPYGSLLGASSATLLDMKARAGKGFEAGKQSLLTPFFEMGWHQWERGVNLGETYTYYHYGIGLLGQVAPAANWVLSAHLLAGRTFESYIVVNGYFAGPLGDAGYTNAGLSADYALTRHIHAAAGLEYTRFRFGRSGFYPFSLGVAWEPASESRYITARIGLGFAF